MQNHLVQPAQWLYLGKHQRKHLPHRPSAVCAQLPGTFDLEIKYSLNECPTLKATYIFLQDHPNFGAVLEEKRCFQFYHAAKLMEGKNEEQRLSLLHDDDATLPDAVQENQILWPWLMISSLATNPFLHPSMRSTYISFGKMCSPSSQSSVTALSDSNRGVLPRHFPYIIISQEQSLYGILRFSNGLGPTVLEQGFNVMWTFFYDEKSQRRI